jgi:acyl carrier protein
MQFEEVIAVIRAALVEVRDDLSAEEIGPSTILYGDDDGSLSLDSLEVLEVVTILEENTGLEMSDDVELDNIKTVSDVANALLALV